MLRNGGREVAVCWVAESRGSMAAGEERKGERVLVRPSPAAAPPNPNNATQLNPLPHPSTCGFRL